MGNEQSGDSQQLKFLFGNVCILQVLINNPNCSVECYSLELELGGDLHNPVNEDGPHREGDRGCYVSIGGGGLVWFGGQSSVVQTLVALERLEVILLLGVPAPVVGG